MKEGLVLMASTQSNSHTYTDTQSRVVYLGRRIN